MQRMLVKEEKIRKDGEGQVIIRGGVINNLGRGLNCDLKNPVTYYIFGILNFLYI
jgi:hypothetical protein